jgi:alpha-tubulin suppressor-like RCC1 family protein
MSDEYSVKTNFREGPDENNIDLGEKFLTRNKFLSYYSRLVENPKIAHRALYGSGSVNNASTYYLGFTASLYGKYLFIPLSGSSNSNWKQITISKESSSNIAAIKTDGTLWNWGYNGSGQLGDSTTTNRSSPVQVGTDWKQVSLGNGFIGAIKTNGTLWTWGNNAYGQLGLSNLTNRSSPVQVGTGTDWKQINCGYNHIAAVKTGGTLWTWGSNYRGELGQSNLTARYSPVQVGTDTDWTSVTCGYAMTFGLKTDNSLYSFGFNNQGQLGISSGVSNCLTPKQVGVDTDWKTISCGYNNTAAIKNDNSLWTWGYQNQWALGISIVLYGNCRNLPGLTSINTNDWKYVAIGNYHMLAIKTDGTLWGWGDNSQHQLGITSGTPIAAITQIGTNSNWVQIVSSSFGSVAIVDNSDEFI